MKPEQRQQFNQDQEGKEEVKLTDKVNYSDSLKNELSDKHKAIINELADLEPSCYAEIADFVIAYKNRQSTSAPKVESSEDDNRLEILNRCSPDFYPVKDDNGHLYPAYGHDNVLQAMEQYATLKTSSLQQENDKLRDILKHVRLILPDDKPISKRIDEVLNKKP